MKNENRYRSPVLWSIIIVHVILLIASIFYQWKLHQLLILMFFEHLLIGFFSLLKLAVHSMEHGLPGKGVIRYLYSPLVFSIMIFIFLVLEFNLIQASAVGSKEVIMQIDEYSKDYFLYFAFGLVATGMYQIIAEQLYFKKHPTAINHENRVKHLFHFTFLEITLIVLAFLLIVMGVVDWNGFVIMIAAKLCFDIFAHNKEFKTLQLS